MLDRDPALKLLFLQMLSTRAIVRTSFERCWIWSSLWAEIPPQIRSQFCELRLSPLVTLHCDPGSVSYRTASSNDRDSSSAASQCHWQNHSTSSQQHHHNSSSHQMYPTTSQHDQGSRPSIAKAPVSYKTATGSQTSTSAAISQSHGISHSAAPGSYPRYPSSTTSQDTASLNERFAVSEKHATRTQKHTAGTSRSTTGSLNERFALQTEPQQTSLLHELRKLRKKLWEVSAERFISSCTQ